MYIWEQPQWPTWQFDTTRIAILLADVRHRQGRLTGRMEALGFVLQDEAELSTLTLDVIKTSEIEGETLDAGQVRSSLARRLGLDIGALAPTDRHIDGVVEMMLDATRNYNQALTKERLFTWHGALFPTGRSGMSKIRVADLRDDAAGPMQVISGVYGHETVHYQAPPADSLDLEMEHFLGWFNASKPDLDPVLQAGLAHFWFVTLHPFDDGNGRIARAIGDMALARSEGSSRRFYSLSAQIRQNRSDYYCILEQTQKGTMDVTMWLEWFLITLRQAIHGAETTLSLVLGKARFWEQHRDRALNQRQFMMLNRLLDGFDGKLTSSKWAKLAKCSQDSALRDITTLLEYGILKKAEAGGRSTGYELALSAFSVAPTIYNV